MIKYLLIILAILTIVGCEERIYYECYTDNGVNIIWRILAIDDPRAPLNVSQRMRVCEILREGKKE